MRGRRATALSAFCFSRRCWWVWRGTDEDGMARCRWTDARTGDDAIRTTPRLHASNHGVVGNTHVPRWDAYELLRSKPTVAIHQAQIES